MSKRSIKIFHSQTGTTEVVESSAASWGELKAQLTTSVAEKTCILSKSKLSLEYDSSVLPKEPFTVFVYPKESKGGMAVKPKKRATKKSAKAKVKKSKKTARKSAKKSLKQHLTSDQRLANEAAQIARE